MLELILHVDGTGGSQVSEGVYGPAAWSFNASCRHEHGLEYLGFTGGIVELERSDPSFIGAEVGTNSTAELSAIAFASLFALQAGAPKVLIRYDAMCAANMATGCWTPGHNVELVDTTAEVLSLLKVSTDVRLEHVFSHEGDPWNELADAGAAAFSRRRLASVFALPELVGLASARALLPWAFLHVIEPDERHQYPPFVGDGWMQAVMDVSEIVALPAGKIAARIDAVCGSSEDQSGTSAEAATWLLAYTLNPQTLRTMEKRDSVLEQFGKRQAHLVGFQEARFRHSELKQIADSPFLQATSACHTNGSGGCALWINTGIPWSTDARSAPSIDDVAIMYATPRLMVCHITSVSVTCDIVVMHASDKGQAEWWDCVADELLPHLRGRVPRIFLADTNTSFSEECMGVIGGAVEGSRSVHAPFAAAAMDQLGVSVMSTFEGYKDPDASLHSWHCHADHCWKTIDVIATSSDISVRMESCRSDDSFWMCADNLDHRPISQLVAIPLKSRTPIVKRRAPQYSRDDVRAAIYGGDPKWNDAKARFADHMRRCPAVSHVVEHSSHRHIVVSHVVEGLSEIFPSNRAKKPFRKPHLSDATKLMIRSASAISKTCLITGRMIKMAPVRFVFRWWLAAAYSRLAKHGRSSVMVWQGPKWNHVVGPICQALPMRALRAGIQLKAMRKQISAASKVDWKAVLIQRSDELISAVHANDSKAKFATLKSMKPYVPKKAHRLADENGNLSNSLIGEQQVAKGHFCKLLGGSMMKFEDLILQDRRDMVANAHKTHRVVKSLEAVPTKCDLRRRYNLSAMNKALGEGGFGAEVRKLCPDEFVSVFAPLHVKATLFMWAPIMWRGSMLHALFKNSGSPSAITSYRDICLGDPDGKDHGAHLRSLSLPAVRLSTPDVQFGSGLNGGGCEIPHLIAAAVVQVADMQALSSALLFIDIRTAFAAVQRSSVVSTQDGTEEWAKFLMTCGFEAATA